MVGDTKVSIRTIRSMDLASILGLIRGSTRVGGSKGSSMDLESIILPRIPKKDFGKTERELSGLMRVKLTKLKMGV